MAWTTPSDWDYKEAPGSDKMNLQIRDNLGYVKASLPAGVMMGYAGATAPAQWLLCQGQAISRSTYSDLFDVIGVTYGAGDASTTFNLPNRKGKVGVGLDSSQAEFDALAETGGAKTHTLSSDEMPTHTHIQNAHLHTITMSYWAPGGLTEDMDHTNINTHPLSNPSTNYTTAVNQNAGGGSDHNNLQPYLVQNYIIKF